MIAVNAVAQSNAPQFMLLFLDYETFHSELSRRCIAASADGSASMAARMKGWRDRNGPAIAGLRTIVRERMIKDGMAEQAVAAKEADIRNQITSFMMKGLAESSEVQLRSGCNEYVEQLLSPEMDYVAKLNEVKQQMPRGQR